MGFHKKIQLNHKFWGSIISDGIKEINNKKK